MLYPYLYILTIATIITINYWLQVIMDVSRTYINTDMHYFIVSFHLTTEVYYLNKKKVVGKLGF